MPPVCDLWGHEETTPCKACLLKFKQEVYQLFGLHSEANPDLVFEDILRWREQDRRVLKIPKRTSS